MRSAAYVFDAYGTLFDVHAAVRRHAEAIGPESQRLSEIWRVKQLEYTWVRTLAGRYVDFWALTEAALDFALAAAAPARVDLRPALLAAYRELDAFAEVPERARRAEGRGRPPRHPLQRVAATCWPTRPARPASRRSSITSFPSTRSPPTRPIPGSTHWRWSGSAWRRAKYRSSLPIGGTWRAPPPSAFAPCGSTAPASPTSIGDLAPAAVMPSLDGLLA